MKIHKFSIILSIPFIILLVIIGYYIYLEPRSNYLVYALIPLTPIMVIYMFSPQIDYWWLSKNPVELDDRLLRMLDQTNPRYKQLSNDDKAEFNKRLVLFTAAREFIGKGMESDNNDVPYDIKNMISQIPVTMTLGRSPSSFKKWERIVLYKHPFPSPRFKFLHTMETEAEDGVVILSLEHVEKALIQRGHHYDVGWHAYAEAFIKDNPKEAYPDLPQDVWERIEVVSPQTKNQILKTLGYENVDALPVLINLYFNYTEAFVRAFPNVSRDLEGIFYPKKRLGTI